MMRWMSSTEIGSTPANGSSSRMKLGSAASARAISTRRRSPPDRLMPMLCADVADVQLLEQRLERRVALGIVEVAARLEDRVDVVRDGQLAEDRRLLRQVADAETRAAVHRQRA